MDKLMDRQALLQDKIDALGAWEIDTRNCNGCFTYSDADTPIKNLSGGNVVAWLCAAFTSAT
jgi:hypothetical protein